MTNGDEQGQAVRATITRRTRITDLPEFVTVEEFAAYMQIGRGLAYEIARSDRRLRAVRVGRLLRISREAIAALVADDGGSLRRQKRER